MKTDVNYVDASKMETIIIESGLAYEPQKGFIKVKGASGRNIYVASTKAVGRVDISGFLFEHPGVRILGEGTKIGRVRQQLDFSRPEAEILETFTALLAHLKDLGPAEKERRSMTPKAAPAPKGWSPKIADRLDLIKRVAAEKGMAVSARTLAQADEEVGHLAAEDGPEPTPATEAELQSL